MMIIKRKRWLLSVECWTLEVRSMRKQSRWRYLAATAVARQWLLWMPPIVTTQSAPCATASAIKNSNFLTLFPLNCIPERSSRYIYIYSASKQLDWLDDWFCHIDWKGKEILHLQPDLGVVRQIRKVPFVNWSGKLKGTKTKLKTVSKSNIIKERELRVLFVLVG